MASASGGTLSQHKLFVVSDPLPTKARRANWQWRNDDDHVCWPARNLKGHAQQSWATKTPEVTWHSPSRQPADTEWARNGSQMLLPSGLPMWGPADASLPPTARAIFRPPTALCPSINLHMQVMA